ELGETVSLVGVPALTVTISGSDHVIVAAEYVPAGTLDRDTGSSALAACENSNSTGEASRFAVLAVPFAPVRVMELTVISNFAIWSLVASPNCTVVLAPVA